MLRFNLCLLAMVLLWSNPGWASQTIEGMVLDSLSGLPIPQVNVQLADSPAGTMTNPDGSFRLKCLSFPCDIILTHIGYHPCRITLSRSENRVVRLQSRSLPGPVVMVSSTRAEDRRTPVTFSNLDRATIERSHTTEDIPLMISHQPNVTVSSDAGNGIGYTYLKIRGFDQKRIGVMINNVPLNDPEEHQVYWVDLGDLTGNTRDIQIQRGVGASLYGSSTLGGAVNILTRSSETENQGDFHSGAGSFGTWKMAGSINRTLRPSLSLLLRSSYTTSSGYRDRSQSDLASYYMALSRQKPTMINRLLCFGGYEKSGLAYNAIPESIYRTNRKYNDMAVYSNSIDRFVQPHFHFVNTLLLSNWLIENTLFYVYGNGYYEQYKDGIDSDKLEYYSISPDTLDETTDLVRRKNVIKNQLGWVARLEWKNNRHHLSLGWNLWDYHADHDGKVIRLGDRSMNHRYYDYTGDKQNYAVYLNDIINLNDRIGIMMNGLWEYKIYRLTQNRVGNYQGLQLNRLEADYRFFSPRIGINLNLSSRIHCFANYSQAWREPADKDLYDTWSGPDDLGAEPLFHHKTIVYDNQGNPLYQDWSDPQLKAEQLHDWEWGWGFSHPRVQLKMNAYWMEFRNEIVPLGTVNAEGLPVRGNAPESIHRGIEWNLMVKSGTMFRFETSGAYSQNYFSRFVQQDWNDDWSGATQVNLKNKTIALFPDWIVNLQPGIVYHRLDADLNFRYQGRQYLDNMENRSRSIDPHWVVQMMVRYSIPVQPVGREMMLYVKIDNLFNQVYETSGYVDGENCYFPGAPRNVFAGLKWGF
ncbi:MAG: TonB-dependent receptor [Candidatus Delongbacteria bacterium]|nr:TonB-dependent receptor [Candidatus Delongbacteria bacterium]